MRNLQKKSKKSILLTLGILFILALVPSFSSEAKWVKVNGRYRYTTNNAGTQYYKNKWVKIKGKYYYFDKKGYRKTGWLEYKGKKYYLNKSGVRVTGFKTIKNKKYYFNKKGVMVTGWLKYNQDYYYLSDNGIVQTGLKAINNRVFYFDVNGKRVSGANIVLGNMTYYFAVDGTLQYTGTEIEKAAKYINVQRMLKGYKPLAYYTNCNLSSAAFLRARELASVASHTRPDGSNYSTVLLNDYPVSVYWSGECISWGKPKTGNAIAYNWLSDQNSAVLLQQEANGISIGTYTDEKGCEYWTAIVVQTK